ncbi:MAG: FAD-binding protein, partial [Runella slithyformis]
HEEGGCLIPQWAPDRLAAEAENGVFAWKANSISELAKKTRLDEGTLEQTVARFNTFVTHQRDEDFGRTYLQNTVSQAPFYAILTHCFSLVTFGGLAVNAQLQVIDNQQQPIEGLYAAGEIVGGGATCGHAFVGGMFLTPALSFGRYLGQKLATF